MAASTIRELDRAVGRGVLVLLVPVGAGVWGLSVASQPILYVIGCGALALLLTLGTSRAFAGSATATRVIAATLAFVLTAVLLVGAPWWRERSGAQGPRLWTSTGVPPWATRRIGDRLYVFGTDDVTVLRADDGVVLATYGVDTPAEASVADNGWLVFRTSRPAGNRVFDPVDGEIMRLSSGTVRAIDGDTAVVADCAGPQKPCAFRAYRRGPDAAHPTLVWSRQASQVYEVQNRPALLTGNGDESTATQRINRLLLVGTGADASTVAVIDITSNRVVSTFARTDTTEVVTVGTAVAVLRRGATCTLSVLAGGRTQWTRKLATGCGVEGLTGYGSVLYVGDTSDGATTAYDLRTGRSTAIGRSSWFQPSKAPDTDAAQIGADIAVQRHGRQLTGIDVPTGRTLWRFDAGADKRPPGVEQADGAVVVLSGAVARSPLRSADARDDAYTVSVLDARTGRVCARLVTPSLYEVAPIGPGQALLGHRDGAYTAFGCPGSGR